MNADLNLAAIETVSGGHVTKRRGLDGGDDLQIARARELRVKRRVLYQVPEANTMEQ